MAKYDPSLGEPAVDLWNGVNYHQDGIWSQLIIYALTFQLMFYITIISLKCARDSIGERQIDTKSSLISLLPEEKWHLGEQYEEFIKRQGNKLRIQQEKAASAKKEKKRRIKKKQEQIEKLGETAAKSEKKELL